MSKRLLFISSVDPLHGPGRLMLDTYEAMKRGGYEVDFYTQYTVSGHSEIHALCGDGPDLRTRIKNYVFTRMQKPAYYFFYGREERPPVSVSHILKQLKGPYDLIYIGFWQGLLSFETVWKIYEKYNAPVVFSAVDYSTMTGGCHYPHACQRYQDACGHCPALRVPDSFTRHNLRYRIRFYERVNPIILCNTQSVILFRKSSLLRDRRLIRGYPIIDESMFSPKEKSSLRSRYKLPADHCFVMLAGVQNFNDDRKGGRYLVDALNYFYDGLTTAEREEVLLVLVGTPSPELEQIRLEHRSLGFVSLDALADLYALSDLFLSPSIEDAGPMMVNQALSCGTPVVSFEIGTALDVVKGKGTGYCARLKDADDFAAGIRQHFLMTTAEREAVSKRCREVALETTSFDACVRSIDRLMETVDKNA